MAEFDPIEVLNDLAARRKVYGFDDIQVQALRYAQSILVGGMPLKAFERRMEREKSAKSVTSVALALVMDERARQDEKWGDQSRQSLFEWMSILGEEYGELCEAVNETCFHSTYVNPEKGGMDALQREATHVAVVAVAIMESVIRRRREAQLCGLTMRKLFDDESTEASGVGATAREAGSNPNASGTDATNPTT